MHIVYLGIVSRPEDIGKIGETSVAGNKMQYNLLKYLSQKEGITLDVVSYHPYKPFRRSKKLFVKTMKEFNVSKCFYGHLHSDSHREAIEGKIENIEFKLVSSDYMNFDLLFLNNFDN